MAVQIQSGGPNVKLAIVDSTGSLLTRAKTVTEGQEAAENGEAYSINTGEINLTTAGESVLLYYKHFESKPIFIQSIILGVEDNGTDSNSYMRFKIYKNPTTGTIISTATSGDILANRNFSAVNALDLSTFYKGFEGATVTNGSDLAFAYVGYGRTVVPIDLVLSQGNSVAVSLDPQANTAASLNCYVVMIAYLQQGD